MFIKKNPWFLIMPAALLSGIIIGSIVAGQCNNAELFETASESLSSSTLMTDSFLKALRQNAGTIVLFCIFGTSFFGGIPTAGLLMFRGYGLGQTVGALISVYGFRGFLAAVVGVFPHNLLYIPFLCLSAIFNARFTGKLFGRCMQIKKQIFSYLFSNLLLFLPIFLGCLIEGYFSAQLLNSVLSKVL